LAASPSPEDGVVDILRDPALSWAPGEFADMHNVYFGTALSAAEVLELAGK
jgi:hypothetical protein